MTMPRSSLLWLKGPTAWYPALCDASGHIQADVLACANPSNLDAAVSTLASQATLALIKAKTDNIPADPAKESGKLTGIDADTSNLDRKLTEVVSDLRGASSKTLTDLDTDLTAINNNQAIRLSRDKSWIRKFGQAVATTTIIYTVTAGKTLYIVAACMACVSTAAAAIEVSLAVRNAADVTQGYLIPRYPGPGHLSDGGEIAYPIPLQVPAGWDVVIYAAASGIGLGSFFGWEE
jgi:hypothetical protein